MRYTEAQVSSELLDQPPFAGEPIKIFICSTPRSGSYMLCRFMINAGLGVPHEYFNPVIMRAVAPRLGLEKEIEGLNWRPRSLRDRLRVGNSDRAAEMEFTSKYVSALIPRRCQNGIFSAKIHFDQYIRVLDNSIGYSLLNGGVFIHMFREDLLKQAISRNFAYMTGRWGIDDAVTTAPLNRADLLEVKGIDREIQTLAEEDGGWRVFLARNGIRPITISYEQLCEDPNGFIARVARYIGIDPCSLRQGYTEPVEASRAEFSSLPSKPEVASRFLTSARKIRGFDAAQGHGNGSILSRSHDAAE